MHQLTGIISNPANKLKQSRKTQGIYVSVLKKHKHKLNEIFSNPANEQKEEFLS